MELRLSYTNPSMLTHSNAKCLILQHIFIIDNLSNSSEIATKVSSTH